MVTTRKTRKSVKTGIGARTQVTVIEPRDIEVVSGVDVEETVRILSEQIKESVIHVIKTKFGDTLFRDQDGHLYRAVSTDELASLPSTELLMLGQLEHYYDQKHELYLFCVFGPNSGTVGSAAHRAVIDAFDKRDKLAEQQAGYILRKFGRTN